MRILITGGAGFIGSHLAEYLNNQGHNVYVLDNFSSGKRENLENFPQGSLTYPKVFDVDCRNWSKFRYVISESRPQFIYHLAATVGVNRVLESPKDCINNNIECLRSVLATRIPGIFASTSEVYGKNDSLLGEESQLIYTSKERWSYAASKLIGEWLALDAGWKSVRFFNVVGPRQSTDYGAVLPKFVSQAISGLPLTVYGDGTQVRTFLDVRDCVAIIDQLREKRFNVVNVGGQHVYTMADLARKVAAVVNPMLLPEEIERRIALVPYESVHPEGFDECYRRVPDLSKLYELLGTVQTSDLSKTILDLASHLQKKQNTEVTV